MRMPPMAVPLLAAGVTILGLALPSPAAAHAVLVASQPAAHSTVAGPDVDVVLHFNSRIDAARSRLSITPASGKPVPLVAGPGQGSEELVAHAQSLPPGQCTLTYEVLSIDGHIARGILPFTVAGR